jgi:hypothetical protein
MPTEPVVPPSSHPSDTTATTATTATTTKMMSSSSSSSSLSPPLPLRQILRTTTSLPVLVPHYDLLSSALFWKYGVVLDTTNTKNRTASSGTSTRKTPSRNDSSIEKQTIRTSSSTFNAEVYRQCQCDADGDNELEDLISLTTTITTTDGTGTMSTESQRIEAEVPVLPPTNTNTNAWKERYQMVRNSNDIGTTVTMGQPTPFSSKHASQHTNVDWEIPISSRPCTKAIHHDGNKTGKVSVTTTSTMTTSSSSTSPSFPLMNLPPYHSTWTCSTITNHTNHTNTIDTPQMLFSYDIVSITPYGYLFYNDYSTNLQPMTDAEKLITQTTVPTTSTKATPTIVVKSQDETLPTTSSNSTSTDQSIPVKQNKELNISQVENTSWTIWSTVEQPREDVASNLLAPIQQSTDLVRQPCQQNKAFSPIFPATITNKNVSSNQIPVQQSNTEIVSSTLITNHPIVRYDTAVSTFSSLQQKNGALHRPTFMQGTNNDTVVVTTKVGTSHEAQSATVAPIIRIEPICTSENDVSKTLEINVTNQKQSGSNGKTPDNLSSFSQSKEEKEQETVSERAVNAETETNALATDSLSRSTPIDAYITEANNGTKSRSTISTNTELSNDHSFKSTNVIATIQSSVSTDEDVIASDVIINEQDQIASDTPPDENTILLNSFNRFQAIQTGRYDSSQLPVNQLVEFVQLRSKLCTTEEEKKKAPIFAPTVISKCTNSAITLDMMSIAMMTPFLLSIPPMASAVLAPTLPPPLIATKPVTNVTTMTHVEGVENGSTFISAVNEAETNSKERINQGDNHSCKSPINENTVLGNMSFPLNSLHYVQAFDNGRQQSKQALNHLVDFTAVRSTCNNAGNKIKSLRSSSSDADVL